MKIENSWQEIFFQCRNNVQASIQPCLKTIREPQPDLGTGAGGDAIDPVDLAAEKAIIDTLGMNEVSFTLISEESGIKKFGAKADECFVTVDPIDGSTNFMHGMPFYACSIAVSRKPTLEDIYASMVTDLAHNIIYTAFKNNGAYRDSEKIQSSKTSALHDALIGLDLNTYGIKRVVPKLASLIAHT